VLIIRKLDNLIYSLYHFLKHTPQMLTVTSFIAAVLTGIFIKLSFAVIGLRRRNKVGLGSGGRMTQTQISIADTVKG
jgi:uncharacterized membrane protein YecN with MAPEG domain